MQSIILEAMQLAQDYGGRLALACSVILAAELIWPKSKYSVISRIRAVTFWTVYVVITALGLSLFYSFWRWLDYTPILHLDMSIFSDWSGIAAFDILGGIVTSLIIIQFGEFFYYWFHRLQHAVPWFWKFHAVHHSLEEMSAFNSNHHFSEELLRIPFVLIPASLLVSFEQAYVPWIWAGLMGWQGIYEHSCTQLHFGWFRYIVPDNRFHRIHHSIERQHYNCNFGSSSALWDIVFRTARFPGPSEWPDVGLVGSSEPKSIRDFLFRPFIEPK